ncbi:MAG: hypothetical protein AAF202_13055, partial [Pseudomonadota bacterium]
FVEEETDHAVVQMNLVELETKNMVWELGRTYKLNSYFDHLSQELAPILAESEMMKPGAEDNSTKAADHQQSEKPKSTKTEKKEAKKQAP